MKYSTIVSTTHSIASATTTEWGDEMLSIVQFLAIPFALVLTALELVVDFFDRPLQTLGMLSPPQRRIAITAPVVTPQSTKLPTPKTQQASTPMSPVRHRTTRKRRLSALSEIQSLTA